MIRLSPERIFVSGTTFGARGIAVLIQEPPNPLQPIGFLRRLQLSAFVRQNVPRKLFVWLVKWGTFARARRLCFLLHGPIGRKHQFRWQ